MRYGEGTSDWNWWREDKCGWNGVGGIGGDVWAIGGEDSV